MSTQDSSNALPYSEKIKFNIQYEDRYELHFRYKRKLSFKGAMSSEILNSSVLGGPLLIRAIDTCRVECTE